MLYEDTIIFELFNKENNFYFYIWKYSQIKYIKLLSYQLMIIII